MHWYRSSKRDMQYVIIMHALNDTIDSKVSDKRSTAMQYERAGYVLYELFYHIHTYFE